MLTCSECEHYTPLYFEQGKCLRPSCPGSKIFADKAEASIIVHATFGCNQFQETTLEKDLL